MTTLDELTRPWTRDEVSDAVYAALAARGVSVTSWRPGSVARTLVYGVSIAGAALSSMQATLARAGFLSTASGDWLSLLTWGSYGVRRNPATFATTRVSLTNSGGGVYSGGIGDLVVSSSVTGREYRSTEPYSLPALGSATVAVQAVEAGAASSVGAGDIDTLVTSLLGVTVTNPAAAIAHDVEGDELLRARARDAVGPLSPNGPRDAYRFVATSATRGNGEPIGVTRVATVADGLGKVTVYVATPSGLVPPADIATIAAAVHADVEPVGINAVVVSAAPVVVPVTYAVALRDAVAPSSAEAVTRIAAALAAFFAAHPIGGEVVGSDPGRLYVDSIAAAVANALPLGSIVTLDIAAPASDRTLLRHEVAVAGPVVCTAVSRVGGVS